MKNAEALGGAGQRDIQLGRAAWSAGEDPVRVDDEHGVELQPLGLRRQHRARHVGGPITTLVPFRRLSSRTNSSIAEGNSSAETRRDHGSTPQARTDSGGRTSGANSASSAAATVMISAGVR